MNPKVWTPVFTPIEYLDQYIRALKMSGTSDEECETIREKHEAALRPAVSATTTRPPAPTYTPIVRTPGQVKVSLKVRKDGKVKLSILNPYDKLLRHSEKGQVVPIESFIQFHKLNGAPDEYLIYVLEKHDAQLKAKPEQDKKFDAVFEKYLSKSSSANKKKKICVVKKMAPVF